MPRRPDMPCADCGGLMWRGTGSLPAGQARCTPCRRQGPARNSATSRCRWCAIRFTHQRYVPRRYCSRLCTSLSMRDGAPIKGPSRHLAGSRRRRLRHALTWDGVTDQQILDRDNRRCHICRKKINPRWRYPDKRSKSVDHVVPLSQGGDDTAANKRAAHLGCNMSRGAAGGGEQLAAFGWYSATPLDPTYVGSTPAPRTRIRPGPCGACGTGLRAGRCWTCEPAKPKQQPRPETIAQGLQAARLRADGMLWREIADHLRLPHDHVGILYQRATRYGDPIDVARWRPKRSLESSPP